MKNLIFYIPSVFLLAVAAALLLSTKVFAFESPVFPVCTNVEGLQLLGADEGALGDGVTRGPGNIFYGISEVGVIQCYCDQEGMGTQTNWWKIPQLSEEEISYFQQEGWSYVQNGKDAGFDEAPYLVKSSSFECKDCVPLTPTQTPAPTEGLTPTPEPGQTQGTSSDNSQPQTQPAPVAILAGTGNTAAIVLSLIGGLLSVSGGFLLKKTLE